MKLLFKSYYKGIVVFKNNVYLIIILCLICVFGCNNKSSNNEQHAQTLYQQILERGTIRVGYVSYPPSFVVNSDKTFSGIFYDVLEKIGDNLGLKIEFVQEVSWDNMIEAIRTKKIDMVCTGIWPTSQEENLLILLPLYFIVLLRRIHMPVIKNLIAIFL